MKWNHLWPALLCLGLIACVTRIQQRAEAERHPTPAERGRELRAGTYNVYGGRLDFAKTAAVIRGMDVDLMALQEVSPESVPDFEREFSKDYPGRFFAGSLGILSRYPLQNTRYEKSQKGGNGFLFAEVEHHGRRLQFGGLHFEPLRTWSVKEKLLLPLQVRRQSDVQKEEVAQVLGALKPGLPTILAGDFNRVSDTVLDRLQAAGYVDSFAAVHSHADRHHTLRFGVAGINAGKRIDFVFHDSHFTTLESRVSAGQPSDHDAVCSALRWNAGRQEGSR